MEIIIIIIIAGLMTLILLHVYHTKFNWRRKCVAQIRNRSDYEEIIEYERSFSQDICGICLEQMKTGQNFYLVSIGHKFHKECMERCLKEDKRCPLCNY